MCVCVRAFSFSHPLFKELMGLHRRRSGKQKDRVINSLSLSLSDWVFKDLPVYANGHEIVYSIDEIGSCVGYTKQIKGTTLINTHVPYDEPFIPEDQVAPEPLHRSLRFTLNKINSAVHRLRQDRKSVV